MIIPVLANRPYRMVSNGSLLDLDCSSLTGWSDDDTGEAESSQVTFDGRSTFKFDSKTSADTNDVAERNKDVGSVEGLGASFVVSINLYHADIGIHADTDQFYFFVDRSDFHLYASFGTDGLFIYGDIAPTEVGSNLVKENIWQEWTFFVHNFGTPANADCDVYLNGNLVASDVDCSATNGYNDGDVKFLQAGFANDDQITYIDWFKIGNGFA